MINELFKKEGNSIYSFKKGDLIIRVKPAIITTPSYNENLGVEVRVTQREDNSYRCQPYEFIAIENNLIYLKSLDPYMGVIKLILEQYSEDWALFVVPEGLTIKDCF